MYTNTDTLTNKINELNFLIKERDYDVLAIAEIFPKTPNCPRDNFVFSGYQVESKKEGRGVCLMVRDNIEYHPLEDVEDLFQPCVAWKLTLPNKGSFIFTVLYRSPNCSNDENANINNLLNYLFNTYHNYNIILCGDFNYPFIDWKKETCSKDVGECNKDFFDTIQNNYLFQLCKEPTHRRILQKPSTIDLILTNNDFCSQIEYLPPLGKSHHSVLEFKLAMSKSQITNSCKTDKYIIDKADFDGMRHYVKQLNLEKAFLNSKDLSVENSWKIINNAILDARDKYVPKVTFSNNKKSNNKDPLPQYILLKIKTKRRLFKIYNKYPTQDNYNSYARARNQVKWETRKFIVNKEKTLAKDVKLNPKRFYQYISSKHKVNDPVADLIKPDGSLTNSDDEKAEVLNNFFSSIFINENNDTLPDFNCGKDISLDNVTVTKEHMLKKLLSLNASKSPGPDGIHPRQLKELAHELAAPLTILFETCMHEGKVPISWKLAEVKPIFKNGDKTNPGNYRPISLVYVICKVFESLAGWKIIGHTTRDARLTSNIAPHLVSIRATCTN